MRQRVEFEPAYVLARRPYRDTSLLLEVFTRDHGRVGLIARGARGPKSKLRGLLQDFTPLLLGWSAGGELGTLHGAEAAGPAVPLSGERVFHGWYLNELLMRLLPRQDAHAALFETYAVSLQRLGGDADEGLEALRLFEKNLLGEIGYALELPDDLDADASYRFEPGAGLLPALPGTAGSYRGASLIALRDEQLATPAVRGDARRLLQAALAVQLGDKPLQTPRLLRQMRGSVPAATAVDPPTVDGQGS